MLFIVRYRYCCSPISVNTTINATANFTCTAIAGQIEWQVNGQSSADANLRNRGFNDQAVYH